VVLFWGMCVCLKYIDRQALSHCIDVTRSGQGKLDHISCIFREAKIKRLLTGPSKIYGLVQAKEAWKGTGRPKRVWRTWRN
jgi:hypothetical protein